MNSTTKRNYSRITKKIMHRYIRYLVLLFVGLLLIYFLAYLVLTQFTWDMFDPWYSFFKLLERGTPFLILIGMMVGSLLLTRRAIKQSLYYVDITLDEVQKLSDAKAPVIELPEELTDVQNELNIAREHIRENKEVATEAVQRKNDLVMYLAHDLKTPLASVIGYLNLLKDTDDLPEATRRKYLDITLEKADRLEDLINEFFDITRFNLSEIRLEYQNVDLTRMLEQTVFEFLPMMQEKGLSCDLQLKDPLVLKCDPDKLQRVFDNILRNAIAYSFSDSVITIALSAPAAEENKISLFFTNHGNTITKENLDRIFEQFYRQDTSRGSKGGTGPGLAIAKQIVLLHHGQISAQSSNGQTTFIVTLPLL